MSKTDESIKFGQKLKEARQEQELLQKDLAEILGINHWNISDMEAGKFLPTKTQFEQICDLLNKSGDFFFPEGVPNLAEGRRQYNKRNWTRPESRKFELPEDEEGIDLDVEDELETNSEDKVELEQQENIIQPDPRTLPVTRRFGNENYVANLSDSEAVSRAYSFTIDGYILSLMESAEQIPQLKSVLIILESQCKRYIEGTGDPVLDITLAFSDKSSDDFFHRKIVNKTR
jgi:transcriptional regulator with XRE-family HTH domain